MAKVTYTTVDEYIAQFESEVQQRLEEIRKTIKRAAPQAQEKISWAMPTYAQNGNVVHFAAHKNHIGFYPGASGVEMVLKKTREFETSKGAVQLPNDKPLPLDLIYDITVARVAENQKWAQEKK